jgi:lysophospholipase L1-like esterase
MTEYLSYLALGDSYTIGEQVQLRESFPYQLVQLLRQKDQHWMAPEIVAQTGWTTDELLAAMTEHRFLPAYDLVTLLIGVNNQYRHRQLDNYADEFTRLLEKAIALASHRPQQVVVLSIPDWGVSAFAANRNRPLIAAEIDAFNALNHSISQKYGTRYAEITSLTREAAQKPELIAADGLHPSGKDYARWAAKLAAIL